MHPLHQEDIPELMLPMSLTNTGLWLFSATVEATQLDRNYSKGRYRLGTTQDRLELYSLAIVTPSYQQQEQAIRSRELERWQVGPGDPSFRSWRMHEMASFFMGVLSALERHGGINSNHDGSRRYIDFSSMVTKGRRITAKRLVFQSCYGHLLPVVVHALETRERIVVDGAQGIALLGYYLLGYLISCC